MGDGAAVTRANWEALRRLALLLFGRLRKANPDWGFEDLQRHLNLPFTKLFVELAEEAGFERRSAPTTTDQNKILRIMLQGMIDAEQIARETGLPPEVVQDFMRETGVPYGAGGYGTFPWPGAPKKKDDGLLPSARPRKISGKGQLSYKGRVYGLGSSYANRRCWVQEAGTLVIINCAGRPRVTLRKRD